MSDYDSERAALYKGYGEREAMNMNNITVNGSTGEQLDELLTDYLAAIDETIPETKSKYHKYLPNQKTMIDVYDVLYIFDVTNPAIAHAIKKLLCTGTRGYKDFSQDLQEAIDSLERAKDFPPILS